MAHVRTCPIPMQSRINIAVKVILLTWAIFVPYYLWFLFKGLNNTLPPYPWPAVIGIPYFVCGITTVVVVAKRMFRQALRDVAALSGPPEGSSSGITLREIYISSPDHLEMFNSLPWYGKWFGILPSGFPRIRVGFRSYPAVYFASGSLGITQDQLTVSAATLSSDPRGPHGNLVPGFQLTIAATEVISVQRFDMQQILKRSTPLPFLRVQTTTGVLRDFLLCSGSPDLTTMVHETENLWFSLGRFEARGTSTATRGPTRRSEVELDVPMPD
jgi:hypothetical protein